ncbi:hypothetical protein [Agromyces seonyuensis]|uniref:Uncharacterized protein n=1 Tax=Agromyces seonyuensis TaxID=2662446 RepID=A0A6I4NXU7_9MICO|nr:hypothetical protein [Agromyces seonyuensis]MWB99103.1 hypothetical protein [Agromyces seonyuensis]
MTAIGTSGIARMMRVRLADATPSRFLDAIVVAAGETALEAVLVETGERRILAHAEPALAELATGAPVAIHAVYGILAIGDVRADVLDLSAL